MDGFNHRLRRLQGRVSGNDNFPAGTNHEIKGVQQLGISHRLVLNLSGESPCQFFSLFLQSYVSCHAAQSQKVQDGNRVA